MLDTDRERWDNDVLEGLLNDAEKKRYQALVGLLLYLMHGTRPDICYAVIKLSQFLSRPREHHREGLKRVLRYVKGSVAASIGIGDVVKYNNAPNVLLRNVSAKTVASNISSTVVSDFSASVSQELIG